MGNAGPLWRCGLGGPMRRFVVSVLGLVMALTWSASLPAQAEDSQIAPEVWDLRVMVNGEALIITRSAGAGEALCPPDCPQPMRVAQGVDTLGAVEVLAALQAEVAAGKGLLVDVRMPEAFAQGHLPGAVNVPGPTLRPENPALRAILLALGASETDAALDFALARELVVYGAGPGHVDAAEAVRGLLQAGVPAAKLRYFRGGMQEWLQFGLTVAGDQGAE